VKTSGLLALLALAALVGLALLFRGSGEPIESSEPVPSAQLGVDDLEAPPLPFGEPPIPLPDLDQAVEGLSPSVAPKRRVAPGTRAPLRVDVVDPWGRPVGNVEVVATRIGEEKEDRRFPVHYAGTCEIDLLVGVAYRLEVIPGSRWFEAVTHEPVRASQRRIRVRLSTTGLRVSGLVRRVDAEEPEPGVRLAWTVTGEDGRTEETLSAGRFDLLVPPANVFLEASRLGWTGVEFVSGRVGDWVRGVEILLHTPLLAEVAGIVLDSRGSPVAGAAVHLVYRGEGDRSAGSLRSFEGAGAARTGETGRFTVSSLAPGRYEIRAKAEGFVEQTAGVLEVGEPRHEVEVRLMRGGSLRVRPRGPDGLPSVGGFILLLKDGKYVSAHDKFLPEALQNRGDADDSVVYPGLVPGAYTIRYAGGRHRGEATVTVPEGDEVTVDLSIMPIEGAHVLEGFRLGCISEK
jgi:hypothetical protein